MHRDGIGLEPTRPRANETDALAASAVRLKSERLRNLTASLHGVFDVAVESTKKGCVLVLTRTERPLAH